MSKWMLIFLGGFYEIVKMGCKLFFKGGNLPVELLGMPDHYVLLHL